MLFMVWWGHFTCPLIEEAYPPLVSTKTAKSMHKFSTFINPEDGDIVSMVAVELNECHSMFDCYNGGAEVICYHVTFLKKLNSIKASTWV